MGQTRRDSGSQRAAKRSRAERRRCPSCGRGNALRTGADNRPDLDAHVYVTLTGCRWREGVCDYRRTDERRVPPITDQEPPSEDLHGHAPGHLYGVRHDQPFAAARGATANTSCSSRSSRRRWPRAASKDPARPTCWEVHTLTIRGRKIVGRRTTHAWTHLPGPSGPAGEDTRSGTAATTSGSGAYHAGAPASRFRRGQRTRPNLGHNFAWWTRPPGKAPGVGRRSRACPSIGATVARRTTGPVHSPVAGPAT